MLIPFIAWELETHFHNLEDYPVCSKEAEAKYMTDQTIRQIYHFFFLTTAHACGVQYGKNIRSPDVSFAEDQIWAKTIIEAGFKKRSPEIVWSNTPIASNLSRHCGGVLTSSRRFLKYYLAIDQHSPLVASENSFLAFTTP